MTMAVNISDAEITHVAAIYVLFGLQRHCDNMST